MTPYDFILAVTTDEPKGKYTFEIILIIVFFLSLACKCMEQYKFFGRTE